MAITRVAHRRQGEKRLSPKKVTHPLVALPAVISFDSHIFDISTRQTPYCWCREKTKTTLLMSEQNKSLVVGAGTKQKPLGQISNPTNFLAISDQSFLQIWKFFVGLKLFG